MNDTYNRILRATMRGVRIYGLEGVRMQNIADLAGLTPGAIYRHFDSKEELLQECFLSIDKQVAALFDHVEISPQNMVEDPLESVRILWIPYFRFWTSHPDETVFYHRFRDSATFPEYVRKRNESHFDHFVALVGEFIKAFPGLNCLNMDIIWLLLISTTIIYAKNVVEGVIPGGEETENAIFNLLTKGISEFLHK